MQPERERSPCEPGSTRNLKILSGIIWSLVLVGIVCLFFSPWTRRTQQINFVSLQLAHGQAHSSEATSRSIVTATAGKGSLAWTVGDCTYWANYRYHELSGYWVAWPGNPDGWVMGARNAGWMVSTQPHLYSILVLMPYAQGAGQYGTVGVVESIVSRAQPGVVQASLMNWPVYGGGCDKESEYNFNVGSGVYFIWHT